jgi:hypothetical protein
VNIRKELQMDASEEMTQKERFDSYMKLAEFRALRWSARQQTEWRLSLGLWALMITAIYSSKTRPPEIPLIVFLLVIFALHTVYASLFVSRSRQDMDIAFFYLESAERCISQAAPDPRERPVPLREQSRKKQLGEIFRTNFTSVIGRTITTGLLAVVVYALIGRNVLPN